MNDTDFMEIALVQAREAAALGEIPVGAVVVRQGKVIATGRNAPIGEQDPTAHAEIMALRAAACVVGNYRLEDCEIFVTLEPCAMCSGALLNARLKRVVFGAFEPKTGAAGSVINLFAQAQLNHQTELQGGVLAEQSRTLLQDFFRKRRACLREVFRQSHPLRDDALRTPDVDFEGLPGYPWKPHYVSDLPALGGLRMHYLDEKVGKEEGCEYSLTYLCLHGYTSWSYEFCKVIPSLLQAGHRVIAPDLIGFGKSDKPKKESFHTFTRHRQTLIELVERLDLHNIVLMAHPQSSFLAFTLPMHSPERYQNLLMMKAQFSDYATTCAAGYLISQKVYPALPEIDELHRYADDALHRGDDESEASHAPFPNQGHRAALRAFPSLKVNDDTAGGRNFFDTVQEFWLAMSSD